MRCPHVAHVVNLAAVTVSFAGPVATQANPIIPRYQPFASSVPRAPEQRAELLSYLATYGLDRFRPEDLAMLEEQYAVFAPVLIESQRAGWGLQSSVIEFVQTHGTSSDLERLRDVLSTWFSSDTLYASPLNGMQVVAPEAIVRHEALNAERWARYWFDQLLSSDADAVLSGGRRPPQGRESANGELRFASEYIRLRIEPGSFEVLATYRFSGDRDASPQPMHYPFPDDPALGDPEALGIWLQPEDGLARSTGFTMDPGRRNWRLQRPVAAGNTLQVHYRQPYRWCRIRYLLTSTEEWGAPIGKARFRVTVPSAGHPAMFNYPFRMISRDVNTIVYEFVVADFMPGEDLTVEWCALDPGGRGAIELVVDTHEGEPASKHPRVTLDGSDDVFRQESDSTFVLTSVPAGTFDIAVRAANSISTEGTVLVLPGHTTRLRVRLIRRHARWGEI